MSKLGILSKLIRLPQLHQGRKRLETVWYYVRQGGPLSCNLFNFFNFFQFQFLEYIAISFYILQMCSTVLSVPRDVTSVFSAIGRKFSDMSLAVKKSKTMDMLSTSKDMQRKESRITLKQVYLRSCVRICLLKLSHYQHK